jgi:ADP-ribosylglycohydrolase
MLGAIAGDIIGSVFEALPIKDKRFVLFSPESTFTDDTVLTVALADSLLTGKPFGAQLKHYYRRYPDRGYGGAFHLWAQSASFAPYHSWGNGAAMRISPVGFAFDTLEAVLENAERFTAVTHNHPEGIKGAQATAAAIFFARNGFGKNEIRDFIENRFGYDLRRSVEDIRPGYRFDVSCQGTVPPALCAFLDSTDFEDAIRNAVSLGGDADTLACIAGGISQAYYGGVPDAIARHVYERLDNHLAGVTRKFIKTFIEPKHTGTSKDRGR